jgi:hypothetical protein
MNTIRPQFARGHRCIGTSTDQRSYIAKSARSSE